MTTYPLLRRILAAFVLLACTAGAFAQDYTVTTYANAPNGSKYVAPPATGATNLGLGLSATKTVTLPFSFPYFGQMYTTVDVCSNGFIQFGATTPSTAYANATFPIQSSAEAGMVAPYWDDLADATINGAVKTWTSGTTPTRVFYVSWEGVAHYSVSGASSLTFQVQLSEGTGRIILAYAKDATTTTWGGGYASAANTRTSYSAGIQAPSGDARYVVPTAKNPFGAPPSGGTSNGLYQRPPDDYQYDPRTNTYTGTIVMDRIVSDGTGLGNSVQTGVPLAGFTVEVQRTDGSLGFVGTTDATGAYNIKTYALASATSGNIVVFAKNGAASVRATPTGAVSSYVAKSTVSFATGQTAGTITIAAAQDATGEKRAPFDIALVLQQVYDWCATRTADVIPQLDVLYDPTSAILTAYTPAVAPVAASLRVGSTGSTNPDAWDLGVLRRVYGRHVLAAISGATANAIDTRFDAATDVENAFAEGFCWYLNAIVSGQSIVYDGRNTTTTTAFDLEGAVPATRKGADVTGWVALALYDLVDAANEAWDRVDGTVAVTATNAFQVVDASTTPLTAATFYKAWGDRGFAGGDLSRDFIRHGMLTDDASEMNDDASEPRLLGNAGTKLGGQILNLYQEDWYRVTLAAPVTALVVDVNFDRQGYDTIVGLEIRNSANVLVTTGSAPDAFKAFTAATGALASGDYLVRIRHVSGGRLGAYSVQAYERIAFAFPAFQPSTVGRPYEIFGTIAGGVPPYTVVVTPGSPALPSGLTVDSPRVRVSGQLAAAGNYSFSLQVTDSGSPANVATSLGQMIVSPPLEVDLAPYTGFPLNRPVSIAGRFTGGTAPRTFTLAEGTLPDGLTLGAADMRFTGTPTTAGKVPFSVGGVDARGSASNGSTVGVVCVPMVQVPAPAVADLAAGDAACGFWFDAIAGSKASISVATVKANVKRTLACTVLDADGSVVTTAKVKVVSGAAKVTGLTCVKSGRYYVILESASGEATKLQGSVKAAAPAAGKLKILAFAPPGSVNVEIGALAGAKLTMSATADAKSGLKAKVLSVLDPLGNPVSIVGVVKTTARGFSLALSLPLSGTWTVIVSGDSSSGQPGTITGAYSVKQPKGVTYSAD
ncbi:MAG: putative Ig domain-containing protein [Planctomycetes bacterium]|nr:putative Ig domain-containing protein [Planctomycetota bacterium]